MTFIGPGLLYGDNEIIHKLVLDRLVIGAAWDRATRRLFEEEIAAVGNVLSCVARVDRQGELSITVSTSLSEETHWETLRSVVVKLSTVEWYGGDIERVLPVRLLVA